MKNAPSWNASDGANGWNTLKPFVAPRTDGWSISRSPISPVRNAVGQVIGASKVARDIGERKRIDESLRNASRRKDEFLALLAHELRNPLAPLANGLQVIRLAQGDSNAVARARRMMERQLAHLVRLVDDLLDVSRMSQNKMELRRSRLLLADVVNSAIETVRPLIEDAQHTLTVSLPREPIHLDGDLTRLSQVFSNLLANSVKYTDPGGQISLEVIRRAGHVVISVRDTGIGIAADHLKTVFDIFSQVDPRDERSRGGLGIGLALVDGLVRMHGGTGCGGESRRGPRQHVHCDASNRRRDRAVRERAASGPDVDCP